MIMRRSTVAFLLLGSKRSISSFSFGLPKNTSNQDYRLSSFNSSKRLHMSSSTCSSDKEALLSCPKIRLNNGQDHPAIGFGTYKVGFIPASASSTTSGQSTTVDRTAKDCVKDALESGYRFLECAQFYNNEAEVGEAINSSGIPRDELFLCSKVWTSTIEKGPDAIRAQVKQTLEDLKTDYLDLYLIHWPVPGKHVEAYLTLQELHKEGVIRGIGLSNYAVEDYLEIKASSDFSIVPTVNQIEINPFLYRKNTIEFFKGEGIVLQSYRSLRDGKAFSHPTLVKYAEMYQKSTAQILGRWCVQHGFVYMPKTVNKSRMVENAKVFDFALTEDQMKELDDLTTPDALITFRDLYRKCVNRDTSKDGTMEGVKMEITYD